MEFVRNLFLVLHLLGLAAIIGSFLAQARAPRKAVDAGMLHGALTSLVTGLVLVGLAEGRDVDVDHVKIAVKLLVVLAIVVLAWRKRRAASISTGEWGAIGGLAILNTVIAVFW